MNNFKKFLIGNNIILTVISATLLALLVPGPGLFLDKFKLVSPLIIIVFFCQGTGVKPLKTQHLKDYLKILLIAFIGSQVAAPVLGVICAKFFNWQEDSLIGFMLICCMAPTLVSGTIIAEQAGGNRTASLMVTIIINILAVFSIPLNLSWTLGAEVKLEVIPLLLKLIYLVLMPAILGHIFRRFKGELIEDNKKFIKYLPVFCLGIVIYISMAQQVESIKQLTVYMLLEYSIGSLIVHGTLLFATYWLALKVKTDIASAKSTAICCSQKTIPITIAIWTSEFSTYSLALLPAIVFHLCQIYFDGIIAKKWSRNSQ